MEITELFRFVAALAFIIALIGLCAFIAPRLGLATGGLSSSGGARRLAIVEVKVVDAKHRLVLVRRDDREHLVLLGGEQGLLIEGGIEAPPAPASSAETAASYPAGYPAGTPLPIQRIVEFIRERRA